MNRRGQRGLHRRNQTQTHFANSMSDRRMEALQILNTLCTLPLEKMNTFLLTCLYLSFTLYTCNPLHSRSHPSPLPQPPLIMQIGRGGFHFTILVAFSFKSSSEFQTSAIRQYNLCLLELLDVTLRMVTLNSYTLCRETKHPNAAVHCLQQTQRRTQTTSDPSAVFYAGGVIDFQAQ